jgi:hypothetical protein
MSQPFATKFVAPKKRKFIAMCVSIEDAES